MQDYKFELTIELNYGEQFIIIKHNKTLRGSDHNRTYQRAERWARQLADNSRDANNRPFTYWELKFVKPV